MNFTDLHLNRVILELRYSDGHLYWDRCGATLIEIEKEFPEWHWERGHEDIGFLINPKRNMELSFNYGRIVFVQNEVENLNQFKEATDKITLLVVKTLEIKKFKRVGNRFQFVYPLETKEQGKQIIQKSQFIQIPKDKLTIFGEKADKIAFVVVLECNNLHYRIELESIERAEMPPSIKIDEQFHPKYGLRVDIDIAIINEVKSSEFNCVDFIQSNKNFLESNLIKMI